MDDSKKEKWCVELDWSSNSRLLKTSFALMNRVGISFASKYDGEGMAKIGRPALNLVLVLDVSSSMNLGFQGHYGATNKLEVSSCGEHHKMQIQGFTKCKFVLSSLCDRFECVLISFLSSF